MVRRVLLVIAGGFVLVNAWHALVLLARVYLARQGSSDPEPVLEALRGLKPGDDF